MGSRAAKTFFPALSMCDIIFSGLLEGHPRLTLAILEFELSWAPNVLTSMDYTYRERHARRFTGSTTACFRATSSAATSP